MEISWKKYAYTFLITAVIFMTAIYISNYFSQKKINEIKDIESQISIDISASETQFSLLSELPCREISSGLLSKELATLGDKLSYTEANRGSDDSEVLSLKKYYSLLQIKDFLLIQKIKDKCGSSSTNSGLFIMYFYSNKGDCPDCQREGYVLTKLRSDYPELRVYSFDYNLDLSAVQTLISVYNVENKLPAILINDKVYYGFKSVDDIKEILPALKAIDIAKAKATTASSTKATSTKVK
ncbi:MAG: hypothetical protein AAB446_01440 [Patescibacteria group bacterium]